VLFDDGDDARANGVDIVLRGRLGHHAHERLGAGRPRQYAAAAEPLRQPSADPGGLTVSP